MEKRPNGTVYISWWLINYYKYLLDLVCVSSVSSSFSLYVKIHWASPNSAGTMHIKVQSYWAAMITARLAKKCPWKLLLWQWSTWSGLQKPLQTLPVCPAVALRWAPWAAALHFWCILYLLVRLGLELLQKWKSWVSFINLGFLLFLLRTAGAGGLWMLLRILP